MRKNKWFSLIDLVIYFNIFVFTGSGALAFKDQKNLLMGIVFIIVVLLNIAYLVKTIFYRLKLQKLNEESMKLEYQVETSLKEETGIDINTIKQIMLENRIEAAIKNSFPKSKTIKNAYVPKSDGSFTEIDLIIINEKGIFIIESKNLTGKIAGSWEDEHLIVNHPNGEQYKLYNPIMQNTNHYYALRNILGLKNELFKSIIVFGDNSYIENYKNIPYFARVCKINTLVESMNKLSHRLEASLEDYEIENIYETIIPFVKNIDRKKEHIDKITINSAN